MKNNIHQYTPDQLRADISEFGLSQIELMELTGITRQATISKHLNADEWGEKSQGIRAMYFFLFMSLRLERENRMILNRLKDEIMKD